MKAMRKSDFIAVATKKIEMYKAFIKVADLVLNEAAGKDGKVINISFVNRIKDLIGKYNTLQYKGHNGQSFDSVHFEFATDYDRKRNGHFKLYYSDTFVESAHCYIDYNTHEIYGEYLKEGKYMDFSAFAECMNKEKTYFKNQIKNLTDAINGADNYIKTIAQIKAYISANIDNLPTALYTHFVLEPAIY